MKKIIYIFLDLLTIAFLIGGYAFPIFYKKKLGIAPVGELSEYTASEEPCL